MTTETTGSDKSLPQLKRSLTTSHMVLYGLGVTVGAGIYVLIGEAAGRAGIYTPMAFLLAAFVMMFSAASFAEMSTRFPVSAGEAAYVEAGFGSSTLSLIVGLCVISVGISSAATVSLGATGYIQEFLDLNSGLIVTMLIIALGLVSVWGVTESVSVAALFALIEVGGLVAIIVGGLMFDENVVRQLPTVIPDSFDLVIWSSVASAGLLAFFAFIGFEDMVNVAEEVRNPRKTLPTAIFLTLFISTTIYFLVASIAVLSGPIDELASASAPLAVVVERLDLFSPATLSLIAIIAGLNGIIVQIIMVSRVLYGLGKKRSLPAIFAKVHAKTRTPYVAIAFAVAAILTLALIFPISLLAEYTAFITLSIFALVNAALLSLKVKNIEAPENAFTVPAAVPAIGLVVSISVLAVSLI